MATTRNDDLPLGYTQAWLDLGVVAELEIQAQVEEHASGDDPNPEHYRWRTFSRYLATQDVLAPAVAAQLYELGSADADVAVGGSMMATILRRDDCPLDLLRSALTSPHAHLRKLSAEKLSSL